MSELKLSIIIPAHNEEKYIEKTLKSIGGQDFKDYEVIVVCNGCEDNTEKIAARYAKVISVKEANLPAARNIGANHAKGEKLVFLDADTRLDDRDILNKIDNSDAVMGTCFGRPNSFTFMNRGYFVFKNFFTLLGMVNGITFCDKKAFNKIGGYNKGKCPIENRDLRLRITKYGKFEVLPRYVTTSMRRYEKLGFGRQIIYWIKRGLGSREQHAAIR